MRRITLDVHPLDAAVVQEVVHVSAAHGTGEHAVDIAVRQVQRRRLAIVNVQTQLRSIVQIGGTQPSQLRVLARLGQKLVFGGQQGIVPHAVQIFEHEVKAGVRAQAPHCGRLHHKDAGIADGGQLLRGTVCKSTGRLAGQRALCPCFQAHKAARRALVTTQARDLVEADYIGLLEEILADFIEHRLQTRIGSTGGQIHVHVDKALVFIGQERGGQLAHQQPHGRQNG